MIGSPCSGGMNRTAEASDGPGAARLLEYLARALSSSRSDEIRSLLGAHQARTIEVVGNLLERFRAAGQDED